MLVTDVFVVDQVGVVSQTVKLATEVIGAILVVAVGKWFASRKTSVKEEANGTV
jgi:hypothetical protein